MNNLKTLLTLLFIINFWTYLTAQQTYVSQNWHNSTGNVGAINRTVSKIDHQSNLIVVSNTEVPGNGTDVLITKYNKNGVMVWQETFDGTSNGSDYGVQLVINSANEIFVASAILGTSNFDFGLLKYDSNGTLLWSSTWNSSNNAADIPADIALDSNGDIYLVGAAQASNFFFDYAIVKFDSNGVIQWYNTYDYADFHDAATSLAIDNNSIIVTGASASSNSNWDYATLKYASSDGTLLNEERTTVDGVGLDNAVAVTSDDNNNVYVTGYVEITGARNIQTIKINEEFGLVWVKNYDGGMDDVAKAIGVDDFGNVYITGYSEKPEGNEYITIKYDSEGNETWINKYGALAGVDDAKAASIAVRPNGDVIITGTVEKDGEKVFTTIKYDAEGSTKFVKKYNSNQGDDLASTINVKGDDVYVTGSTTDNGVTAITTVKYTLTEKTINYTLDSLGVPIFEANDILVRLDTNVLIHSIINKKAFQAGKLEDFIKPNAVIDIRNAVKDICGSDKCDITVYKIFRDLKTTQNTTISRLGETIRIPNFWATLIFECPDGVDVAATAAALKALYPIIKYAELNLVAIADEPANDELYDNGGQASLVPTSDYDEGHINVEEAWDLESGRPHVKVGIMDSGIRWTHEDFGNGTPEGTIVKDGWIFAIGQGQPLLDYTGSDVDDTGHGTKCAGIIGAIRNNEIGIAGIAGGNVTNMLLAPDDEVPLHDGVSLYGLKVLHQGAFDTDFYTMNPINYVAEAIVGAAINDSTADFGYGLHIMNNSYGIKNGFQAFLDTNITLFTEATHFANRAKVTFVASRGNHNGNSSSFQAQAYPANTDDDWVLTVSGTKHNGLYDDNVSMYGGLIDVAAPSSSDLITTTYKNNNQSYSSFSGTSAAAPHVTGVASLLMSYLNDEEDLYSNLAPEDVEYIIQMTAFDANFEDEDENEELLIGYDKYLGFGRVDAGAALMAVDTNLYALSHFQSGMNDYTASLVDSNVVIQLTEAYYHYNSIADEEEYYLPDTDYLVNIYKVTSSGNYHSLADTSDIVAYWPRPSSSTPFAYIDSTNKLLPRQRITIDNLDENSATLSGYIYEVFDMQNNPVGWWPSPLTAGAGHCEYSILHLVEGVVGIKENERLGEHTVSLFPNPANGSQTISVNTSNKTNLVITLYDIQGQLVKSLYNKTVSKGITIITVNLNKFPKGMYVYHVLMNEEIIQLKTVKN